LRNSATVIFRVNMDRRSFLSTAGITLATAGRLPAAATPAGPPSLIDTNVHLSHWTTRHTWVTSPEALSAGLKRRGVTSAWVGSFEGVLHSDLAGANARLALACAGSGGLLRPFGTVNPAFPDWEDDLRRCHEEHRMPGVRLYPSYHGYSLDDPRFIRLLERASRRRLLVQIVVTIEDDRSQNPALTGAPVQTAPLADALEKIPSVRVMLLNSTTRILGSTPLVQRLTQAGAAFEIATLEGVAGIESLLQKVPDIRLCFGSHTPYFYFEAARLKLEESALTPAQLAAVRHVHASSLLPAV
jgi:predicted TIM-barrel fold metal-dependent hydrolase